MEDQKPWPGLAGNQDFAEGGGLEVNVEKRNVEIGRHDEPTSVTQMHHKRGSGGEVPAAGQFFCDFFEKNSYFNAIGSHVARF